MEIVVLAGSLMLITQIGTSAHRWMWHQAELLRYRTAMQELTDEVRAMRVRSLAQRRPYQMRIDSSRGMVQTTERILWLPEGLLMSEAPAVVTSEPSGLLSPGAIVVTAPAYQRAFRVTIRGAGQVRLDEQPTS